MKGMGLMIYISVYIFVKFIQGYNGICGGVGHPPAASSGQFLGGDRWQVLYPCTIQE